jgi:hypothetical protein
LQINLCVLGNHNVVDVQNPLITIPCKANAVPIAISNDCPGIIKDLWSDQYFLTLLLSCLGYLRQPSGRLFGTGSWACLIVVWYSSDGSQKIGFACPSDNP